MLVTSAVLFGTFLLTSIYLQDVLGASPLETGLAFLPLAVATGLGAHLASHAVGHAGLRGTMVLAFVLAAIGTGLLSRIDGTGTYVADVLPGMLVAGVGLGLALVGVALAVLSGASEDEAGMLSGLNTTGHEVGGSIGIAVLVSVATASAGGSAAGIGDAFAVASVIAIAGGVLGALLLPSSAAVAPKLHAARHVPVH